MTAEDHPLRPIELLSTAHDLSKFDSGVPEIDRWLGNSAHVARTAGTAATYVLLRGQHVVAY